MKSDRATFLKNYAYLLFLDIARLGSDEREDVAQYEKREKGFCLALAKAYMYASAQTINRKLSVDLFKQINARAISHLDDKEPGKLRVEENNFFVGLPENFSNGKPMKSENPNASIAGLIQFVNYWIRYRANPIHFLHFKTDGFEAHITPVRYDTKVGLWCQTRNFVTGRIDVFDFRMLPTADLINKVLQHFHGKPLRMFVNTFSKEMLEYRGCQETVVKNAEQQLEEICSYYNANITTANTEDDTIRVIVTALQRYTQVHPFNEGNIRTLYVMLNRLLDEEGLSRTILLDPNRFDCYSIDELVILVKTGQRLFKDFMEENLSDFNDPSLILKPILIQDPMPISDEMLIGMLKGFEDNFAKRNQIIFKPV